MVAVRWVEGLVISLSLRDTVISCEVDSKPPMGSDQPLVGRFPYDCPKVVRSRIVRFLHSIESMTIDRLASNRRSYTSVRLDRWRIGRFFAAYFNRCAIIHGRGNVFR
jgi:hypothetical protein